MRSKLFDRDYRRANGGSKALDDFFIEKTSAATSFQDTMQFTNEYLFNFFDLDSTKLYERKDAIQTVTINNQKREMFTFTSLDQTKPTNGFLAVLKKLLSNNLLFAAAPSDFIKDLAAKAKLHENLGPNKDLNITAKARQFGTYTYGQIRKDALYASPYVPVFASENREVFQYNRYFANQTVVDEIEGRIKQTDVNTKKTNPAS